MTSANIAAVNKAINNSNKRPPRGETDPASARLVGMQTKSRITIIFLHRQKIRPIYQLMAVAKKILVADDEDFNRTLLKFAFQKSGFLVVEARDGAEALDRLNEGVDFLLLDIRMPKLSGLEVLEKMLELEFHRKVPVVMVSANDDPENRARSKALGAKAFFAKPIATREIVEFVSGVLRGADK